MSEVSLISPTFLHFFSAQVSLILSSLINDVGVANTSRNVIFPFCSTHWLEQLLYPGLV